MVDNGSIVDLEDAVIEVGAQARQSGQGATDCGCQWAFARCVMELGVQPSLHAVEDRFDLGLSDLDPFVGRRASRHLFDRIECGDPPDLRPGSSLVVM